MVKKIDITTANNALKSLKDWLNIPAEDVLKYFFKIKANYSFDSFIEYFNIGDSDILSGTLSLASLHVTTNSDNCTSIKKFGMMNLQETIKASTPLGIYLKEHDIKIDLDNKEIVYKGKTFDINNKSGYAMPGSFEYHRNMVIHKLYHDYQINGFLCIKNALKYGGGVRYRPEFIGSLAAMLGNRNIEHDWITPETKCYVLKYYADLSEFTHYTFDVKVLNTEDYEDNREEYELEKRKWVLKKALAVIYAYMYSHIYPEEYSYTNFNTRIPSEQIEILTAEEYREQYKIEE